MTLDEEFPRMICKRDVFCRSRGALLLLTGLLLIVGVAFAPPAMGQEKAGGAPAKPPAKGSKAPDAKSVSAKQPGDAKGEGKPEGTPEAAAQPSEPQLAPAKSPLSETRLQLLRQLVEAYFVENPEETSEYRLVKAVLAKFAETDACPQAPKDPAMSDRDIKRAAANSTRKLVAEKFPALDEKVLVDESVAAYPIYEEGEIVTVKYQANPARPSVTKKGYYHGRKGDVILIGVGGGNPIRIPDMEVLPENKEELLKFDRNASLVLRQNYVEAKKKDYEAKRAAFEEAVKGRMLEEEQKWGIAANEKNGHILMGGQWLKLKDALLAVAVAVRGQMGQDKETARQERLAELDRLAGVAIAAQATFDVFSSPRRYCDPEKLYTELKAEEIRRAEEGKKAKDEAEAKAKADKEAAETNAKAAEAEALASAEAAKRAAALKSKQDDDFRIKLASEKPTGIPIWLYAVIALALGGGGAVTFFLIKKYSTPDPQKFFKAKGKMQKNFWAMAEADPEHFKYCAYRFPDPEQGRLALLSLSYMQDASGEVRCKRPGEVLFGVYPHQDKAVAFMGGTSLGYAMWREATAVWPELPGAEYFRVSTAPDVTLEAPNIQELMADSKINITFVERKEAEDYTMHHIYKAPDEQSAMAFLEKVEIKSADVRIIVHTPTATFRKGLDGLVKDEPGKEGGEKPAASEAGKEKPDLVAEEKKEAPGLAKAEQKEKEAPAVTKIAPAEKAHEADAAKDEDDDEGAETEPAKDDKDSAGKKPDAQKPPIVIKPKTASPPSAPKKAPSVQVKAPPAAPAKPAAAESSKEGSDVDVQKKPSIAIVSKDASSSVALKTPGAAVKIVVPPPGAVPSKSSGPVPAKVAAPAPKPIVLMPPKSPAAAAPEGEKAVAEGGKPEAPKEGGEPRKSLTLLKKKVPEEGKK